MVEGDGVTGVRAEECEPACEFWKDQGSAEVAWRGELEGLFAVGDGGEGERRVDGTWPGSLVGLCAGRCYDGRCCI